MSTPDVTRAQILAFAQAVLAVAVAFGLTITKEQQEAILALSAFIGAALVWADVRIRKHRAENAAAIASSQKGAK